VPRSAGRRRRAFEEIVQALFAEDFAGRILPFDSDAAREFAVIASSRREEGKTDLIDPWTG
jgi:toxin FitB